VSVPTTWVVTPSVDTEPWEDCEVTYAATIPAAITTPFTFDAVTTTFTLAVNSDPATANAVGNAGDSGNPYPISILPSARSEAPMTATETLSFTLTILDPCELPQITVVAEAVNAVSYTLTQPSITIPTSWTVTPSVDTITW